VLGLNFHRSLRYPPLPVSSYPYPPNNQMLPAESV
jgi:hypothetical protein